MSKKEKIFPLNTFGGRMQDLRKNRLNISRPEFYDLIFPNGNVATESKSRTVKNWEKQSKKFASSLNVVLIIYLA